MIVVHLTADKPGVYSGSVNYSDVHGAFPLLEKNSITIAGALVNGLRYGTKISVLHDGGTLQIHHDEFADTIEFKDCDSLTILAAAGTNYVMDFAKIADNAHYRGEPPHARIAQQIQAAEALPYDKLKAAHVADYQSLFNRFSIDLGTSPRLNRGCRRMRAGKKPPRKPIPSSSN